MTDTEREEFFRELYGSLLAALERGEGGPFAAGVVLGGRLIAVGTNSVLASRDVSRHAEINALAEASRLSASPAAAGAPQGGVQLPGAELLSTHFPCLMCYHAAKWAMVSRVHYLFDYEETEEIFGFLGDRAMLGQIGLPFERLAADPALPSVRVRSARLDALYRVELPRLWNGSYRATHAAYDIGRTPS